MPATLDDVMAKLNAIEAKLDARPASRPASTTGGSAVFPNYGKKKNEPVAGAELGDLEYYANGCRRTLDDPAKSRWHDKERALLAAIEAEIARQKSPTDTGDDTGIPF